MMVGLLACGKKPADSADSTTSANSGNSNNSNNETTEESRETTPIRTDVTEVTITIPIQADDDKENDAYVDVNKFQGKTLQIAGLNSDSFADLDNMGKGTYNWMMRAAIDEWATLNGVTVTFECGNSSTDILSTINSGTKLDLQFGSNEMPIFPNLGLTRAFTQEEYDQLVKIAGAHWVDTMFYKGAYHAIMYPWTGNGMYYWNDTVFKQYGAKTPADYLMEDNWTTTTMAQSWVDVTRDFDGNGKLDGSDTYGMGGSSTHLYKYSKFTEDFVTGKVTGTKGTSPYYKELFDIIYKAKYQTMSHSLKGTNYCTTTSTPRSLAQVGDCEWYNFEHQYRTLENGDVIKATLCPAYSDGLQVVDYNARFMCILSSSDEPEAAFNLLCYLMKVGLRYISDYSCGLYKCEYDGIQGASEYSAGWLKRFKDVCEDRRAAFAEIEDWDQAHYEKMVAKMFAADTVANALRRYPNMVEEVSVADMPSASALPLLQQEQDAWTAKYNELYAN